MKKYMTFQQVTADPMDLKTYEKKTGKNPLKDQIGDANAPGYVVMNSSGFSRWIKKEVFESQYAPIESPKERMELEFSMLMEKHDTLLNTLGDEEKMKKIEPLQKQLMAIQLSAMETYLMVLEQRLK